uniref:Carotenoid oxygenase n=1 Tax=Aegilops tauschii subsp. strangulata TaxID=200361 RepID=A0A453JF63_AEGTS
EDGDLQTLGLLEYDQRLKHPFTAHPKVDPFTDEMFTFGYSHEPPYCTYRVITKDGIMLDPVPITIPESVMMHDFAITANYSIFMDLPMLFRPKEMVKNDEFIYKFDPAKKARFGILQRYEKDEKNIKWFELPNCFIFHNANAWEEGSEVILITCRHNNVDLDQVNGNQSDKLEDHGNELCTR